MGWQTVKIVLRLIWRALLCLSFGAMIALGLLMAYGLVPGIRGGRMAEVIEWSDFARSASDGSLGKIFFSLAAINLVLVWGWLIHCAARLDFLRLAAGLLAGTAIIGGLLFLTPAHCSRSPDLTKVGTGFEIPSVQHPVR
ncbi:MAG TPA: hypothetical protein VIT18_07380 [Terrimicrobiaceae bacterium]